MRLQLKKPNLYDLLLHFFLIFLLVVGYFIIPAAGKKSYLFYMGDMLLSLIFVAASEKTKGKKNREILFWVGLFIAAAPMTFRAQTGIDDGQYKAIFNAVKTNSFWTYFQSHGIEKGYLLLNYVLWHLSGGNYNFAQIVISLLTFWLWGRAIEQSDSKNFSHTVQLLILWSHFYFLIMGAGLVRIFMAIPLVLSAIHYLSEGNRRKFVLKIIAAAFFHMSALIMLLLLLYSPIKKGLIKNWKLKNIFLIVVLPIMFLLIGGVLAPKLGSRYLHYAKIGKISINLGSFDVLPVFLVGLWFLNKIREESKNCYVIGLACCFCSVLFSVLSSMVPIGRVIFYANIGIGIVFSQMYKQMSKNVVTFLVSCGCLLYIAVYMMHTGMLNTAHIPYLFPYVNIWGWII